MPREQITIEAPEMFIRLCTDHYCIKPERLLSAMAYSLCLNPPRELVLIEREAVREESLCPAER